MTTVNHEGISMPQMTTVNHEGISMSQMTTVNHEGISMPQMTTVNHEGISMPQMTTEPWSNMNNLLSYHLQPSRNRRPGVVLDETVFTIYPKEET
jgi:hypothetical protein